MFFETTPAGRILNRFSRDIETVDSVLPQLFEQWLGSAFDVLATITILLYTTPVFLAVAIPLAVLYYYAQVAAVSVVLGQRKTLNIFVYSDLKFESHFTNVME